MKPEATPLKMVCTLCGLDWKRHGARPTAETCVKLLKEDLRQAKATWGSSVGVTAIPYFSSQPPTQKD